MIETKKVTDRRDVSFETLDDLLADVEAMDAGTVRAAGNWTAAQNVQHVARVITGALDGTDIKASLPMRIFGKLIKGRALTKPFQAGIKLPTNMSAILPDPDVTWESAVGELRSHVERLRGGERMTKASPFFGKMTHEEWEKLHCRHAELHFSFIHPE